MRMKPEKNQITWGLTIFLSGVALMLAYYVIFDGKSIIEALGKMVNSISGILIGIVIAYILIPLQNRIERKLLIPLYTKKGYDVSFAQTADRKKRKQMRGIAVLITMLFFILVLYSLFGSIIPQLVISIREIANNFPRYIKNIDEYSNLFLANQPELQAFIDSQLTSYYETLSDFITQNIRPLLPEMGTVLKVASRSFLSVIGVLFDFIVGFIVAIYVLNSKERFTTRGKKLAYALFREDFANELVGGFRFVHRTFESFIGGKLIDSLIIGIICYFGCLILKINYPLLISVIVGVTNIIPFFGPYIGGGAGALLLVLINPIKALVFIIFVIVLQQFDGNILGPRILGGSTGLSSFWVIFAITFFGGLWGLVGWLIGVPIFAVIYALFSRITNHFLKGKGLSTDTSDYYDLAYLENGEYKHLSDNSNTRFNAVRDQSTLRKIFSNKNKIKKD